MRGYRKRPGTQGFSVPLVGASLFFIISLFLFASYKNSALSAGEKGNLFALYGEPGRLIWMRCIRTV